MQFLFAGYWQREKAKHKPMMYCTNNQTITNRDSSIKNFIIIAT